MHLHVWYPDPISHRQDPHGTRDAIEGFDRGMVWYWEHLAADPELVTVLTIDHATPSTWAGWPRGRFNDRHGGEPSPLAIRGGNLHVDSVRAFDERSVAAGGLGLVTGEDFMPVLLNAAERTNMWEMRPMPVHRLHRPAPRRARGAGGGRGVGRRDRAAGREPATPMATPRTSAPHGKRATVASRGSPPAGGGRSFRRARRVGVGPRPQPPAAASMRRCSACRAAGGRSPSSLSSACA
ncbi:MAG: hypothetical protein FJZ92_06525 [Chloroflexi bacterium]|nr:hypothetical protein [Chloroflexota bacterium]